MTRFGPARPASLRGAALMRPLNRPMARARRWLVSLAVAGAGVIVLAATQSSGNADVENMWLPGALVLILAGATLWVWRAPESAGFEALRWRRLHRRVFWRAATLSLVGGLAALWLVAFWQWRADGSLGGSDLNTWDVDDGHARFFGSVAGLLSAAAPALVLIEPFVWRLWPRSLQLAVRRAKAADELANRRYGTKLMLDPSLGARGRPEPILTVAAGEPSREPHEIRPHGHEAADWPNAASAAWGRQARLGWNGSALVVTDGQMRKRTFPVVTTAADSDGADGGTIEPVAELVWFTEDVFLRAFRSWQSSQVLLLDQAGRRIAELPSAGFTAAAVSKIAKAAGLPFAAYNLGTTRRDERLAHPMLFPRTRRTVKVTPMP